MKSGLRFIVFTLVSALIILSSLEGYIGFILSHPNLCPKVLKPVLKAYYHEYDQDILQYNPTLARFDTALFYTLKPGVAFFENREFRNEFRINSLGLRDDAESLHFPKIIVLGDSYSMGWGVDQDSTYAQVLERKLGVSVLNMGVSSYGTAREFSALEQIKTDSLKYLIIQYCPNDLSENESYYRNDNVLKVSSRKQWNQTCEQRQKRTAYYPLKHVLTLPGVWEQHGKIVAKPKVSVDSIPEENIGTSKAFINIIRSSNNVPKTAQIIVFNLEAEHVNNGFISLIKNNLDQQFGSTLHDQISYMDLTEKIDSGHRFVWDPHLNSRGHAQIAELLSNHLSQLPKGYEHRSWFYPSSDTSISCEYLNGFKHGTFKAFWPNGKISRSSYYQLGLKQGSEVDYSDNGDVVNKRTFLNDEEVSIK